MPGIDLSSIAAVVHGLVLLDTVRLAEPAAGAPVFNPDTGGYDHPAERVVYEGPGAVQPAASPGGISSIPVAQQPWEDETASRYVLLTPLDAPVPRRDQVASVVEVHAGGDTALLGRTWRVQDPGRAGTLSVVRVASLDQMQQQMGDSDGTG